ncbi:MAG: hypothetical protein HZC13_06230, partial [Nitrospirae bacterium]|nr:hypothetical protein [Nitrospirota bacterium]
TGKKALTQAGGSYLIVLRGRAPWPELGIMIQPVSATSLPQYIGTANSVITIRKEL